MKILVTGGAGFIGSWLVEKLLSQGHSVTVIDNLSPQIHGALPQLAAPWLRNGDVEFIRADVRDKSVVDEVLNRVEAVVHLAAETGTGQSMYQIGHYYDVNQQSLAGIFEAIGTRHRHIKRVILASSRSIYGEGAYRLDGKTVVPSPRESRRMKAGQFEPLGPNGEPLELIATSEEAPASPASVYAATKLANETLGRIVADAYGICVVALRFQNVYGERQSLRNPYTGILSIFSNRLRQGLPLNIFEDGHESRDFVHVSDVVAAIGLALDKPLSGFHAINVGSGIATSVLEISQLLRKRLKSTSPLAVTGDYRAGDIRHCYADIERARNLLDFVPTVSIAEGLARFCDWVLEQPIAEDRSETALLEMKRLGLGSSQ